MNKNLRHTKGTNNASDSLDTYMFQKKNKKKTSKLTRQNNQIN